MSWVAIMFAVIGIFLALSIERAVLNLMRAVTAASDLNLEAHARLLDHLREARGNGDGRW